MILRQKILNEGVGEGEFTDEKIIQSSHTTCFDSCLGYQSSGMFRIIITICELFMNNMEVERDDQHKYRNRPHQSLSQILN